MVICLERDADLHMAQLMPLPFTVSCFSQIQIGFTFLVPAHPASPRKRAVKRVCYLLWLFTTDIAADVGVKSSDMEAVKRAAGAAADIGSQSSDVEPVGRAADVAADAVVQSLVVEPFGSVSLSIPKMNQSDEPFVANVLSCSKFYKRQPETVHAASQHVSTSDEASVRLPNLCDMTARPETLCS